MKYLLTFLGAILLFWGKDLLAQPVIEWERCIGGSSFDQGNYVEQVSDGGYIVAGTTKSLDGHIQLGNNGYEDAVGFKLNYFGQIEWHIVFGGSNFDLFYSATEVADGGFVFLGVTASHDMGVPGYAGSVDGFVVKTDAAGNVQWSRSVGILAFDEALSISSTDDGGVVLSGLVLSDIPGNLSVYRGSDAYLMKLDVYGNTEWVRTFGGTSHDVARSVSQTPDGGYIAAVESWSEDYDFSTISSGCQYCSRVALVKTNAIGEMEWIKPVGAIGVLGALDESKYIEVVQPTADGGYVAAGFFFSDYQNEVRSWIAKVDQDGDPEWETIIDGTGHEYLSDVKQTPDGGYVFAGISNSPEFGTSGPYESGMYDCMVGRLNSSGQIVWLKKYGGTHSDHARSVDCTTDGGYVFAGYTLSPSNGDVSFALGAGDFWVVKLTYPTILPVHLLSFVGGKLGDSRVLLEWRTASEKDSHHFTVFSSVDMKQWKEIGRLLAAGHSQSTIDYSLIDEGPSSGVNYYKLCQTDISGAWQELGIVAITIGGQRGLHRVFDHSGRLVRDWSLDPFLDIRGTYFLLYEDGSVKRWSNMHLISR